MIRMRPEPPGETDHSLGGAKHQIAVRLDLTRQPVEHTGLALLTEIDQRVAAEHEIERAEPGDLHPPNVISSKRSASK